MYKSKKSKNRPLPDKQKSYELQFPAKPIKPPSDWATKKIK